MRLTTEIRATPAGVFTSAMHWNLCCHVDFTHEERAIIEQRGMHHLYLQLPRAERPLGQLAYVGIGLIRPGAKVLLGIAAIMIFVGFFPNTGEVQVIGTWLLLVGIGIWLFSWWKEHEVDTRLQNPEQQVPLGRLLPNPDFFIHAYTIDQAEADEANVRDQLSNLSARIKDAAEARLQRTYQL
jgi:hypothetical protein